MQKKGYHLVYEAIKVTSDEYMGLSGRNEYNATIQHVFGLLQASYSLISSRHFAPSLFLSITIFEEIAKIKAGLFRSRGNGKEHVKRGKDPLFHHASKHKMAVDPIHLSGGRLEKLIGKKRIEEFCSKYDSGEYSRLREDSLYFSRNKEGLHIPSQKISSETAIQHFLIAIEIFDDEFGGVTAETEELFVLTAQLYDTAVKLLHIA